MHKIHIAVKKVLRTVRTLGYKGLSTLAPAPNTHRKHNPVTHDLRGAVLCGPDIRAYFRVERAGFTEVEALHKIPGVEFEAHTNRTLVPANLLDWVYGYRLPTRYKPPYGDILFRQYQIEGLNAVYRAPRGAILGLDCGLGKTLIACAYVHETRVKSLPFLVVGPLVARTSWVGPDADPAKYFGLNVTPLEGAVPDTKLLKLPSHGFFIHYELLESWQEALKNQLRPRLIICDESHEIRNGLSKKAKAIKQVAYRCHKRILLSATPVVNGLQDLYSQLCLAQPGAWGSYFAFVMRYLNAKPCEWGGVTLGDESNTDELAMRLSGALFRRSRFQVRDDLPDFERVIHYATPETEFDQDIWNEYKKVSRDCAAYLAAAGKSLKGEALQRANLQMQMLGAAKVPLAVQKAKELLGPGKKIVIYTWFRETAKEIQEQLKEQGYATWIVTGGTTKLRREQFAQAFRDSPRHEKGAAFIATLKTASQAMNQLVAANQTLFVEMYWTPYLYLQGEGRTHREGQQASKVWVVYLIARKTVDEHILRLLEAKTRAMSRNLGDKGDDHALGLSDQLGGSAIDRKAELKALVDALGSEGKEYDTEIYDG